MSERDALLAAVLADPTDDTARLVYADGLEETGPPVARARARFIRLQIELAAYGREPAHDPHDAFETHRQIDAIAAQWARAWLAELPLPVANALWKLHPGAAAFRRGFVDGVALPAGLFREHAAGLFAATPLTALHLHCGPGTRAAAGLLACPHVRRLRSVRLSGGAIGASVAHRLAKCPDLGAVREFDLSGCLLSDAGALDLARFKGLGQLDLLRVRHNRLTAFGIDALASAVPAAAATQIDVSGNPGARLWAARRWERGNRLVFEGRQ